MGTIFLRLSQSGGTRSVGRTRKSPRHHFLGLLPLRKIYFDPATTKIIIAEGILNVMSNDHGSARGSWHLVVHLGKFLSAPNRAPHELYRTKERACT